jgi:uncharacterized protein YbbC (DUF1343 family)
MVVQTGLERLRQDDFKKLKGRRLGVLSHPASLASDYAHLVDLLLANGQDVRVLWGPEHGFLGHAQDMESVPGENSAYLGIPSYSLYGSNTKSLYPRLKAMADIDVLVVDLQDVGARYYTFAVSMRYCMEVAGRQGVQVMVLDRPNPIDGISLEGPLLKDEFRSFVGGYKVPIRHGLTLGELARLTLLDGVDVDLQVVEMQGWSRGQWYDQTALPWVFPSPNMPTLDTACVYPGTCLLEATNISEGRGTTRPFELVGAPFLDAKSLACELCDLNLPGVAFRPAYFRPAFQKHAGKLCQGVQIHVEDRFVFNSFTTGLCLIQTIYKLVPEYFRWRKDPYEFVAEIQAIDLLTGSDGFRKTIEKGQDCREWSASWQGELADFQRLRQSFLLYGFIV